jgi:phosphoribosylglycinamide formyltransferase 1
MSSRPEAIGLLRAKRAGVATELTPLLTPLQTPLKTGVKKIDWTTLIRRLDDYGITHVFLAGFMRLVPKELIERFSPGRIVNLHPSLLPAYPGLKSIERAHHDGAAIGCTVHEVIEEVDSGRHLMQRQTLSPREVAVTSLEQAEFLLHVDEQRLVRETISRLSRVHQKRRES